MRSFVPGMKRRPPIEEAVANTSIPLEVICAIVAREDDPFADRTAFRLFSTCRYFRRDVRFHGRLVRLDRTLLRQLRVPRNATVADYARVWDNAGLVSLDVMNMDDAIFAAPPTAVLVTGCEKWEPDIPF